jgi:cytochrome P450
MRASQRLPPGPAMPAAIQTAAMWAWPAPFLGACKRRYGTVFTLRALARPPLIFVCEPADIEVVLKTNEQLLQPGDGAAAVKPIVGEQSFMLQHGAPHRDARKALQTITSASTVQGHVTMIEGAAQRAIDAWPTGTPIELHPGCARSRWR